MRNPSLLADGTGRQGRPHAPGRVAAHRAAAPWRRLLVQTSQRRRPRRGVQWRGVEALG